MTSERTAERRLETGFKRNSLRQDLSAAIVRLETQLRKAQNDRMRAQRRVTRLQNLLDLTRRLLGQ